MRPPGLTVSSDSGKSCHSCTNFVLRSGDQHGSGRCLAYIGSYVNERFVCDAYDPQYPDEDPSASPVPRPRRRPAAPSPAVVQDTAAVRDYSGSKFFL